MTAGPAARGLRDYAVVTAAYWAFTLTDGALRMLVLLHFHAQGFSPFQLAMLFVLYEVFGVVTNLIGGWIGSRLGLKVTLLGGLVLQVAALLMLSAMSSGWSEALQVAYVVAAQGLSGIAKDFTKLSSKSSIKVLVSSDKPGRLFRWVALLTGSKNMLKGVGFFLGGLLLASLGFRTALWSMAGLLGLTILASGWLLPRALGQATSKVKFTQILSKARAINVLSAARMFLFCARDIWFVVGLPVFLYDVGGWTFVGVGAFMAAWVVGYGFVQMVTPAVLRRTRSGRDLPRAARVWSSSLALTPLAMVVALWVGAPAMPTVVSGLTVFGLIFAVNSSLHSYLILAYAEVDSVALDVGFYYMANAGGRLLGTLLSGVLYQAGGIEACLLASGAMVALSCGLTFKLPSKKV